MAGLRSSARHLMSAFSKSACCPAHNRRLADKSTANEYAVEMICSTIRFGPGVTQEVGFELQNAKKVMLLTDATLVGLSPVRATLDSLRKYNVPVDVYDSVRIEPNDSSLRHAIEYARKRDYDAYVAVGGGSVLDTSKVAALYAANKDADLVDFMNPPFGKDITPPNPMRHLVCIPTTSGTGSETTAVSVFDLDDKGLKIGLRRKEIKPHLALVDPDHLQCLPRHQTIYTGFDTLCHALESFTALPYYCRERPETPAHRPLYQGRNMISDVWSREALRIINKYFERAVADASDTEARAHMAMASSFAGIGFGNAGVHLCHGLSYPISSCVRDYVSPDYPSTKPLVPHGLSVCLTAPADFEFTAPSDPGRHREAAQLLGADVSGTHDDQAGHVLADRLRSYLRDFGCPNGISAVGYEGRADAGLLADRVMASIASLKLSPMQQTRDDVERLYEKSMTVY